MELIPYAGWERCARLSNSELELVCPLDIGPRVIRLARPGGPNLMQELASDRGQRGGERWRLYGGHRLWHAPEHPVRTYEPDNEPVAVSFERGVLRLSQRVEPKTSLAKSLEIEVHPRAAQVRVLHRIKNEGLFAVELAPWAATVMAVHGRAILPQEPAASHPEALLPARPLVLWPYTDLSDPRWTLGARFLELTQDPARREPQKIGALNKQGWLAAVHGGTVFVKTFRPFPDAPHTDYGSNCELFTNGDFIEVETLGPLARLEPGAEVCHTELWHLFDAAVGRGDAALTRELLPLVREAERRDAAWQR